MKSIALNLLDNPADAEDAVQEAFIKIYRSAAGFKGEACFKTWIYRILVNVCYDQLRLRRRRRLAKEITGARSTAGSTACEVSHHPLRLILEQSLGSLPQRERTVFLLFEVEGFRHKEIATILDMPEGTSKSLLSEARRHLQSLIRGRRKEWK